MRILWYLKVIIFYCGVVPAAILIATLGNLLFFLPDKYTYSIIASWAKFFIFWLKVTCNINYAVSGMDNIPNKSCVVLSNHQSTWETAFIQATFPPIAWILKKELKLIPFFGWGLALLKPVFIDRKHLSSVKFLLKEGKQRLDAGKIVVLFPEGTRVQPGVIKKYSSSGAALAISAKVDILPIAHNAGLFWPRGFLPKQSGTINVLIGKPISTDGQDPRVLTEQVEQWIRDAEHSPLSQCCASPPPPK
jgi:1-acyl-sn-glycerol-3-phosphate acyltransferase